MISGHYYNIFLIINFFVIGAMHWGALSWQLVSRNQPAVQPSSRHQLCAGTSARDGPRSGEKAREGAWERDSTQHQLGEQYLWTGESFWAFRDNPVERFGDGFMTDVRKTNELTSAIAYHTTLLLEIRVQAYSGYRSKGDYNKLFASLPQIPSVYYIFVGLLL